MQRVNYIIMYKLFLFFLFYFLIIISCEKNTQKEVEQVGIAEIDTTISNDISVNELEAVSPVFPKKIANSMDIALVSDPFFPAIFNTINFSNFELFYYNAVRLGIDGQLFTIFDSTKYDAKDTFLENYAVLNDNDIKAIIYAKDIILSPFLSQYNPDFVSMLSSYRKSVQRSQPLTFSLKPRNNSSTDMQVDNQYALQAMAQDIASVFANDEQFKKLVILADLKNPLQMSDNIRIVLQHLYQKNPSISTEIYWKIRHLGEEQQTIQDVFNLNSYSTVFLLFIGGHIDVTLQYMVENKSQWQNKVFVVRSWKSILRYFETEGIIVASVDNGLDVFFQKKQYNYALLRRYN